MTVVWGEERLARQALLHAGEPGDRLLAAWVERYGPTETVARLRAGHDPGADGRRVARLRAALLDQERVAAALAGARLVVPEDTEWPGELLDALLLRADRVVPHGLWVRGPLPLDSAVDRCVAVVGARASTAYGEHATTEIASGLCDAGWTVVSGAAYGIDGAAHRACLAVGGTTVAVLAGGVADAYPKGHAPLLTRIADEGLVVSELPLEQHPSRSRFLERNRLIAALARGTVAVEMARRSGAANTLGHAESMLRPVMAVPGPVSSPMSAGCHDWIQDRRADLVTDATDVLRLVAGLGEITETSRRGADRPTDPLGPDALLVFDALPAVDRLPMDQISSVASLPVLAVGDALRELVERGLVDVVGTSVRRARATRRPGP
ncbi:MAG TPA: DNA-processing protein DprA [Candidatus Limnocylindria bacterium]|nr:DNA-processing protein DprA [Candidatus Limnocylindria bacterium]